MMMVAALQAGGWDRNTMQDTAGGLETPEPGRVSVQYDDGREPVTAPPARKGFQGLRGETALRRIWGSSFMPGLPFLPAKIIASRPESLRGARAPVMPIKPAATLTPVLSVEQSPPWYEHGADAFLQ